MMSMKGSKFARGHVVPLVLVAIAMIALSNTPVCSAQGEVSHLAPVYPSWQRVIEQLRQVTAQQKAAAAAAVASAQEEQLLLPMDASAAASKSSVSTASVGGVHDQQLAYVQSFDNEAQPNDTNDAGTQAGALREQQDQGATEGDVLQQQLQEALSNTINAVTAPRPAARGATANGGAGQADSKDAPQQAGPQQSTSQPKTDNKQPGAVAVNQPAATARNTATSGHQQQPSATKQPTSPPAPSSKAKVQAVLPKVDAPKAAAAAAADQAHTSSQGVGAAPSGADATNSITVSTASASSSDSQEKFPSLISVTRTKSARDPEESTKQGSPAGDKLWGVHVQPGIKLNLLPPNNLFWWQAKPEEQQQQQQQPDEQHQQQQPKPWQEQHKARSKQHSRQQPAPSLTTEEARSAEEADKKLAGQKILPREPLHISPPPRTTSVAVIDTTRHLLQIPSSFLGISHEWTRVEDINTAPGYKEALKLLSSYSTGPFIIRVGGGSTDSTKDLLPQGVYKAMYQVHKETGASFILGLNFEDTNQQLTQGQWQRAQRGLPESALVAFELGNEPNFYATKNNMTALEYSRCCFTTEWTDFARNLSCPCGTEHCCVDGQFAGPVWGHINVYPSTIKWFLDNAARYVSLVTVHWYKATKEVPNTPESLLEEAPIRREMDNLRQLVQVANSFGKPLRVAEMNSISNSGRLGVSNVFASALWTLDGAFEVAAAGAVGVNLHQGAGQNLYTAILRREEGGKLKPVVLRPAFYGMLMFQQAVANGCILLDKQHPTSQSTDIKLWPLLDTSTSELRVVIINKNPRNAVTQVIKLPGASSASYQSIARLSRLVAQGEQPLNATTGITLGGHYYAAGCVEQGHDSTLMLEADAGPFKQLMWSIYLPPGSATLVRIQPHTGVV